ARGAPLASTVASTLPDEVRSRPSRALATCVSSDPATIAPMSSERMIAARRRTGSGSGLLTAWAAHSMSFRVLAAAWERVGFWLGVMRGCYEKTRIYRMDGGNR